MTERRDLWWVAPASIALLVLILVSGAGNFQYGLAFGGPIIGGASIASDIFKVVALIGVFALWRNRHRFQAAALFVLFLGFTGWSMLSAVGFMSTQFATLEDTRGKTASEWQELTAQINRLRERRRQIAAARPESVVEADINALLRTPGAGDCSVINGPVTAQICPQVDKLRKELGNAKSASWLDGRLEELRKELGGAERVTVIDPRTDSITALSGLAVGTVALIIKFFFAGLIELATAVGLWAVWSPYFGKRREAVTAAETKTAPTVAEKPETPAQRSSTRADDMARWDTDKSLAKLREAHARMKVAEASPIASPPEPDGGTPKPEEKPAPKPEDEKEAAKANVVDFPPTKAERREQVKGKQQCKPKKHGHTGRVVDWMANATSQEADARTLSKKAYNHYEQWCSDHGFHPLPWRQFTRKVSASLSLPRKRDAKTGQQILPLVLSDPAQWQKRRVA